MNFFVLYSYFPKYTRLDGYMKGKEDSEQGWLARYLPDMSCVNNVPISSAIFQTHFLLFFRVTGLSKTLGTVSKHDQTFEISMIS